MGGDTATTTVAGHLQREVTKPRSAVRGEATSIGPDDTFLPFCAFNRFAPEAPGQWSRERQHPGGSQRTLSGTCLASVLAMGPFLQRVCACRKHTEGGPGSTVLQPARPFPDASAGKQLNAVY